MLRPRWWMAVALLMMTWPRVGRGQGEPKAPGPKPAAPPGAAEAKPPAGKPAGEGKPADQKPAGESPAGAAAEGAVEGAAEGAATRPAEGEAEVDDDWGLADEDEDDAPYIPPMVMPDYRKPQPEGQTRQAHHRHRWVWHNLTAVRANPLGATNRFRTGYRMQLSDRPEPIFLESYASAQLDTEITPAFGFVGPRIEVQPMALFNFWGSYGLMGTFGTFSYTRSFDTALAHYGDDTLSDTRDQDYASIGHRATASGLFQIGIAGLAMRDNVQAHWMDMDLAEGDTVFWDATLDVLFPDAGWVVTNDADLLLITDLDFIVGLRYTLTHAIYRDEHLAGGVNINTPHHRVGPAFIYTFFDDGPGTLWNKPSIILLAQWWVKHRYRTGDDPALPYVVLAFSQEGDFMISEKE